MAPSVATWGNPLLVAPMTADTKAEEGDAEERE
jgi:hypothetical protein